MALARKTPRGNIQCVCNLQPVCAVHFACRHRPPRDWRRGHHQRRLRPVHARFLSNLYVWHFSRSEAVYKCGSSTLTRSLPFSRSLVTAVGGTTGHDPEVGTRMSGGGFSAPLRGPDYQEHAVFTFLPDLGIKAFTSTAATPPTDIATQARGFPIFLNGDGDLVAGTSASAPVCASSFTSRSIIELAANVRVVVCIISLLDGLRVSEGKLPQLSVPLAGRSRPREPQRHRVWLDCGLRCRGFSAISGCRPYASCLLCLHFRRLLTLDLEGRRSRSDSI